MNKEHIISVDASKCNGCGLCLRDCPHKLWRITGGSAEILSQDCLKCGHCVAICPQGAIGISGFEDTPEEISAEDQPDAETLLSMMKQRRSIRHFTSQDVSAEIIDRILDAGRYSPTAMNRQAVSYVVLREHIGEYERTAVSALRALQPVVGLVYKQFRRFRVDDHFFFRGAPVVIVVKSNNVVDGALAAAAMELTARSYGLGVLYNGLFPMAVKLSPALRRRLSAVSRSRIVVALVLGYPAVKYHRTAQRESPLVQYD